MILVLMFCVALLCPMPLDQGSKRAARLRGGYMGEANIKVVEPMARAGMNTAIVKFGRTATPLDNQVMDNVQKFAYECVHNNVAFMPVINWWGDSEPKWVGAFDGFVTSAGVPLPRTPCPYSPDFWDKYVISRFLAFTAAIGTSPIAALCLDTEMYGGDAPFYSQDCYCDRCFARYLASRHRETPPPPATERARIVNSTNELEAYRSVQREMARQLAGSCLAAVAKVRPGLGIGVFHLDLPYPFYEGLALGFGSDSVPVICFTEHTYNEGYSPYIGAMQRRFRELGAVVDSVVGIFQSKFVPQNLAEQLYNCAKSSAGYWIYTMETFSNPSYQSLAGIPGEYWSAIARANRELDQLARDPQYASKLMIGTRIPPPPPLAWDHFVHYDLVPTTRTVAVSPPSLWLRKANWVYFWAKQGDQIDFRVDLRQLGNYQDIGGAGLASPRGEPLAVATVRLNEPGTVKISAPQTGIYGIAFQAGMNAVEVTHASHPFAVHVPAGADGAFLAVHIPQLFLSLLPGTSKAVVELSTPTTSQAVRAAVSGEDGSLYWSGIVDGVARVGIDHPHGAYLRIDVEKLPGRVLQDLHMKVMDGLMPLATSEPAWLLRAPDQKPAQGVPGRVGMMSP